MAVQLGERVRIDGDSMYSAWKVVGVVSPTEVIIKDEEDFLKEINPSKLTVLCENEGCRNDAPDNGGECNPCYADSYEPPED